MHSSVLHVRHSGEIGIKRDPFRNVRAGPIQPSPHRPAAGEPGVKTWSELTKKALQLTISTANNGAGVLVVFTASLRSLLIALV